MFKFNNRVRESEECKTSSLLNCLNNSNYTNIPKRNIYLDCDNKQTLTPTLSRWRGSGFTLAETLIALVIIGVVAALTVPTLMNKTQNQEFVSKLKKTHSILSQTTNKIIAEEGTPNASKGGWAKDADTIYNLYKKHLNNAKDCGIGTGCFEQLNKVKYKALNNGTSSGNWDESTNYRNLILSDGVQVSFQEVFEACDKDNPDKNGSNQVCALINVDLNGERKPNTIGRDVFEFVIKEKGLYPAGCESDGCLGEGSFGRGYGCTCKVLRENAMNY